MFCMRCRAPRTPAADMIEYQPIAPNCGRFVALCSSCGSVLDAGVNAHGVLSGVGDSAAHRDFTPCHAEQPIAFKSRPPGSAGEPLSKATLYATFAHLKRFFTWLTEQPGHRSRLRYGDAEYFNLSRRTRAL